MYKRQADWTALSADKDAVYDELVEIDLSALRPLAACPHSPDAVRAVEDIGEIKVDQCCIGSCTNSSCLLYTSFRFSMSRLLKS